MRPRAAGVRADTRDAGDHHHDDRSLDRRRRGFNRMPYGAWTVPAEAASDVDDLRLHHADLEALDEVEVHAELLAATWALGTRRARGYVVDREWLAERRRRLGAALRERRVRS